MTVTNALKPRGVLCKRAALMRWTGWSETYILKLVQDGRLKTWHLRDTSRPLYFIDSAQSILDEAFASRNGAEGVK